MLLIYSLKGDHAVGASVDDSSRIALWWQGFDRRPVARRGGRIDNPREVLFVSGTTRLVTRTANSIDVWDLLTMTVTPPPSQI
jgi:hypothetical protein